MSRAARLQMGPAQYKRRQPPARYMHNGELRPCRVCRQVVREGCILFSQVKMTPRAKFTWEKGKRVVEMETLPDGEVQPKVYVIEQPTNYHAECEADEARRLRRLMPTRKQKREAEMAELEKRIKELETQIEDLKAIEEAQRGPNEPRRVGYPRRGISDSAELRRASQVGAGAAGSGVGERVREKVGGRKPVVRGDGWDWLRDSEAELPHHLRHNLNRPAAEAPRQEAEDLLAMLGQPISQPGAGSEADPES